MALLIIVVAVMLPSVTALVRGLMIAAQSPIRAASSLRLSGAWVATPDAEVEHVHFDPTGLLVSLCVGAAVWILTTAARQPDGAAPEPLRA